MSDEAQPGKSDIPPCAACGSERMFEFQVQYMHLNYFIIDNLGVLQDDVK